MKRGTFRSIVDLQVAINRYLAEHNQAPRPFIWTKTADQNASVHVHLAEPEREGCVPVRGDLAEILGS